MSTVDEVVGNLHEFARVERCCGTEPTDMAIACCDVLTHLYQANGKSLAEAKELLEAVWNQKKGRAALRVVE